MLDHSDENTRAFLERVNKPIDISDEAEVIHDENQVAVFGFVGENVVVYLRYDLLFAIVPAAEFNFRSEVEPGHSKIRCICLGGILNPFSFARVGNLSSYQQTFERILDISFFFRLLADDFPKLPFRKVKYLYNRT